MLHHRMLLLLSAFWVVAHGWRRAGPVVPVLSMSADRVGQATSQLLWQLTKQRQQHIKPISIPQHAPAVQHRAHSSEKPVEVKRVWKKSAPNAKASTTTRNKSQAWKEKPTAGEVFLIQKTDKLVVKRGRRVPGYVAWYYTPEALKHRLALPPPNTWWMEKNFPVDKSWKVADLRLEAERRGLDIRGLKQELIDRINESYRKYRLSDDNFTTIPVIQDDGIADQHRCCFPEYYEDGALDAILEERKKTKIISPDGSISILDV